MLDSDADGVITTEEATTLVRTLANVDPPAWVMDNVTKFLDADGSGQVTVTEWFDFLESIGFEVKGTTILGLDADLSRSTKLRKPDDFIKAVLTKSANQIRKEWSELTTKTKDKVNGRINKDTILVRVMAK